MRLMLLFNSLFLGYSLLVGTDAWSVHVICCSVRSLYW